MDEQRTNSPNMRSKKTNSRWSKLASDIFSLMSRQVSNTDVVGSNCIVLVTSRSTIEILSERVAIWKIGNVYVVERHAKAHTRGVFGPGCSEGLAGRQAKRTPRNRQNACRRPTPYEPCVPLTVCRPRRVPRRGHG